MRPRRGKRTGDRPPLRTRTGRIVGAPLLSVVCLLSACLVSPGAGADDAGIHGRLELADDVNFARPGSLAEEYASSEWNEAFANLRIAWEPSFDRFNFSIHELVSIEEGAGLAVTRATEALLPPPPSTLFNLGSTLADHDDLEVTQRIDRLMIGYTSPELVVRLGRQALTWGSGLVFRPMDLFDPFAPNATDTDYKPGTDMAYAQYLFQGGGDLAVVAVPGRPRQGEEPTADASAFAMRLQASILGHDTEWLIGRDHGDLVAGFGVNGRLGGATWNLELVPTAVEHGRTALSAVANVSDARTLMGRNTTLFAEYFLNGFGVRSSDATFASLPPYLLDRLARGELFDMRRNYLAAGATIEASPLFNLSPTVIADLDDGSLYILLATTYSLHDNLMLVGGAQAPIGHRSTEFGGLPLAAGQAPTLAPPGLLYVQLRRYF